MNIIVAADDKWGIGGNGKLLWNLPEDLRFFREKTMGNVVIMGRKTFDTLPNGQGLDGRINIVLSRSIETLPGAYVSKSIPQTLKMVQKIETEKIFIIGGGRIYEDFLPYCDTAYVTRVDGDFGADTWFPDLDSCDRWELKEESPRREYNGVAYRFTTYERLGGTL